ncbi:YhcN/YlaJ family sporulation lipoprotein [Sediminibacillus albus]|uniref:Sporulation lipoprotein YhcN/YlaJ (Spore_YhcN_YlaJ) n=1 Tax=Sediminibacillus albus TaxID=407036 RepID=A0A1G8WD80_9BACI|nr:YhcN/YlaJ family sporulation lipoprotein [Sediminibacillus albus]SDJ76173.1 Sporulation lipoprotein YhcN/YlaJ (Spore_YhcN_YlaJ) [Sediminibacillus albus]
MKHLFTFPPLLFFCLTFSILSACTGDEDGRSAKQDENYDLTQVSHHSEISQEPANAAKRKALKNEAVIGSRGVNTDKNLLIGIEVRQLDRIRLKKLEKQITTDLEKQYPDKNVQVSTDKKIYLELDKLESRLQKKDISKKELDKKYNQIKKLINDQA